MANQRVREVLHEMLEAHERKARTVKVRIAVAVDESGGWSAAGWCDVGGEPVEDDLMASPCLDACEGGAQVHFVTAELPVPESVEVAGEVEGEPVIMGIDMAEPGGDSTGYMVRQTDGSFREATEYEVEMASRVLDKRTLAESSE